MNDQTKVQDSSLTSTSPLLQYTKYFGVKKQNGCVTKFDPFKSPPDFQQAILHGIARRVCKCGNRLKLNEFLAFKIKLDSVSEAEPHNQNEDYDEEIKNDSSINEISKLAAPVEYCPCCKLPYENEQIPLCVSLGKITHLGGNSCHKQKYQNQVTFPLYFQFIKKCAFLLTVQFLLSGGYSMLINFYGNACYQQKIVNFICQSSLINVIKIEGQHNLQIESVYNFVYLLVAIILIEIFKVHQEVSRYEIEKHRVTPADFTFQISGFSRDMTVDEVERFVHSQIKDDNNRVEIVKIYFIFDMDPYTRFYKQKLKLIKQRNKCLAKLRKNDKQSKLEQECQMLERRVDEIDEKLDQYELILQDYTFKRSMMCMSDNVEKEIDDSQNLRTTQQSQLNFSGRVLVTVNDSQHCKQIVDKWRLTYYQELLAMAVKKGFCELKSQSKLQQYVYMDRLIKVSRSAEPSDINWMNIGSVGQKGKKQLIINVLIFAIFCSSFGILVFIKRYLKEKQRKEEYQGQLFQTSFAFIASTIVALTNTLIGICLRKFAGLETHKKHTKYYVSVGKSLSYLFFINMVCTTLFSNFLVLDNTFLIKQGYPFNLEGLMNDFFFLFITNTYLSSIFNYFDLLWGYRLLRRKQQLSLGDRSNLSQQEANSLFEGHPVDMALRYANVIKLMFFTSAVSPFLPIGLPMSLIGLLILYWVDKYLLLRRYVCHNYLDSQLAEAMMNILPLCTVFFSFGNALVMVLPLLSDKSFSQFQWPDYYSSFFFYLSFIGFLISLVYRYTFQIPWIKKLVPKKNIKETYIQCKKYFSYDYESFHPVLRENYIPQSQQSQQQQESKVVPQMLKQIRSMLQ